MASSDQAAEALYDAIIQLVESASELSGYKRSQVVAGAASAYSNVTFGPQRIVLLDTD